MIIFINKIMHYYEFFFYYFYDKQWKKWYKKIKDFDINGHLVIRYIKKTDFTKTSNAKRLENDVKSHIKQKLNRNST